MTIGNKIKEMRKKSKLSQSDLSKLLNMKQSTIANYEKDTRKPNIDILMALADIFGTSLDELVGYNNESYQEAKDNNQLIPLSDRLLDLILNKRIYEAKRIVDEFIIHSTLEEVFFKLFRIVLTKLGWLWEIEEITISDEHYVSYEITKMINQLTDDVIKNTSINTKSKKFVGMAVPGEKHNIGLKMMLAVLETKGYSTRYIGDAVPISDLKHFLELEVSDVLILSITSVHFHQNLLDIVKALPNEKIVVAGLGVSELKIEDRNVIGCYKKYDKCMEALL